MSTKTSGTEESQETPEKGEAQNATGEPQGIEAAKADSEEPMSIAKDDAFHILQNARRRAVLRYLVAHSDQETFRMRDLAEEVAAWEHDTTVRELTSDERQRVYIALYQSHLPKLDDHGVIDYNQSRGVVEPTRLVYALDSYLEDGLHADTDKLSTEEVTSDADKGSSRFSDKFSALFSR